MRSLYQEMVVFPTNFGEPITNFWQILNEFFENSERTFW